MVFIGGVGIVPGMMEHVLNEPVWSSLATDHAHLAIPGAHLMRYIPEIGPMSALRDTGEESLAALAQSVAEVGPVVLAQSAQVLSGFRVPDGARVTWDRDAVQMVCDGDGPGDAGDDRIERLGDADAAEMLALAVMTKPGPFAARTHKVGRYWGVRQDGRLIAMAGERLSQPGFIEVSAICTHPEFEGQGLGRALTVHVTNAVLARGEVPYLHVFKDNPRAIGLYEALGYRWRQDMRGIGVEVA